MPHDHSSTAKEPAPTARPKRSASPSWPPRAERNDRHWW